MRKYILCCIVLLVRFCVFGQTVSISGCPKTNITVGSTFILDYTDNISSTVTITPNTTPTDSWRCETKGGV